MLIKALTTRDLRILLGKPMLRHIKKNDQSLLAKNDPIFPFRALVMRKVRSKRIFK